ncbi:MAG TPA: DUF2189 domain-containing protein [Hyphomicrobiaceae bacterium]|nr:DUF2189 domain-containing protein [Hyphomicrobiaceae bacterium]
MAATHDIDQLPPIVPPIDATRTDWRRCVRPVAAFSWLRAGWRDFATRPGLSLVYGVLVYAISLLIVGGLVRFGHDYILFPALSGFLVVGPLIATGLYEKSRRLANGLPVGLADMISVKAASNGQILFVGILLCGVLLAWMRAAVLLYAIFFGLLPFPGLDDIVGILIHTPRGWALLVVGSLVGGLFAAFSLSVSVFAIPMLHAERTDAFTAMGQSMALVWNNRPVMLTWGAIVTGLSILSMATGLLGLIIIFPVLGHATWHAYMAMRVKADASAEMPASELDGARS